MRRVAAIVALCMLPVTSNAAPEESLRLYSDICYNVEGGDALGVRVGIIQLGNAPYVFLQWSEGAPDKKPEMVEVSAADLSRGKLVFSASRDGKPTIFRGTITAKALTGTFSPKWPDYPKEFQLRRVPVRQKFPDCK